MKTEWFGERTDKQINGTKQRAQEQTPINTVNWSWKKEQSNTTEQRQSLQQMVLESLDTPPPAKDESRCRPYIRRRNEFKRITDLNVKCKLRNSQKITQEKT